TTSSKTINHHHHHYLLQVTSKENIKKTTPHHQFLHKIPFNKTKQWNVSYYQNLKKALLLQQE
ncbi:unnamed protein product, partial [Gordionus sp. m RMFG-2023]